MVISNIKHQVCCISIVYSIVCFIQSIVITDREAIGEFEGKIKELRKQVDDTVKANNDISYSHVKLILLSISWHYFMLLIHYILLVKQIKLWNILNEQLNKIRQIFL